MKTPNELRYQIDTMNREKQRLEQELYYLLCRAPVKPSAEAQTCVCPVCNSHTAQYEYLPARVTSLASRNASEEARCGTCGWDWYKDL